jgi:hypothetical protein
MERQVNIIYLLLIVILKDDNNLKKDIQYIEIQRKIDYDYNKNNNIIKKNNVKSNNSACNMKRTTDGKIAVLVDNYLKEDRTEV